MVEPDGLGPPRADQPLEVRERCSHILRRRGRAYPRTCALCGLGPCQVLVGGGPEVGPEEVPPPQLGAPSSVPLEVRRLEYQQKLRRLAAARAQRRDTLAAMYTRAYLQYGPRPGAGHLAEEAYRYADRMVQLGEEYRRRDTSQA